MNQSESPKERINVTYKPATGDMTEDVEIPFKVMVLGEFNPDEPFKTVEEGVADYLDKLGLLNVKLPVYL